MYQHENTSSPRWSKSTSHRKIFFILEQIGKEPLPRTSCLNFQFEFKTGLYMPKNIMLFLANRQDCCVHNSLEQSGMKLLNSISHCGTFITQYFYCNIFQSSIIKICVKHPCQAQYKVQIDRHSFYLRYGFTLS